MNLHKIISALIENWCINRTEPVLVGISGGPDSLALAHLLHSDGFQIILAHLDHMIRPEAHEDAEFVSAIAKNWGIPVVVRQVDVKGLASSSKLTLEEAGRLARYQFLFEVARQNNAQAVMVGHNADDQVETMLMHFLRGAGLDGLKAMPLAGIMPEWDKEIPLVRPLLYTWRDEITAYCEEHQLEPRLDSSNLENTFFRNRLRNELIPILQDYNPNIKEVLLRSNKALADDQSWLQEGLELAWKKLDPQVDTQTVRFGQKAFLSFHPGAQRNLLRRMISQLVPHARDISFETIQSCLAFVKSPTRSNVQELEQSLVIRLLGETVLITKDVQSALHQQDGVLHAEGEETRLEVPGKAALAAGGYILAEFLPVEAASSHPSFRASGHAFIDAEKVTSDLIVRKYRKGDRFSPLGMGGRSLTLADFWTNEKLPRELRKNWPMVCLAGEIIWLPGYRISEKVKIIKDTKHVVHLWVE